MHGAPRWFFFTSTEATDKTETLDFIKSIPIIYYAYILYGIFSIYIIRLLLKKTFRQSKKNILLFSITLIALAPFNKVIINFYTSITHSINRAYKEIKTLDELHFDPKWEVSKVKNRYKNYVIIIGESARKDYHSVYGYPVKNTPFLDSVNGVFIDGMMVNGIATIPSLRFVLASPGNMDKKNEWFSDYNFNIVDLANKSGFNTFWISNQGKLGSADTSITAIANRANKKIFIKQGAHYDDEISGNNSYNKMDSELIPLFKKELIDSEKSDKPNVFFIHLFGNHIEPCSRLENNNVDLYKTYESKYHEISCYVAAIKQTDSNINEIFNILESQYVKSKKESFSIIYFSDHGLTHYKSGDTILFRNINPGKEHFSVPFLKISSDDSKRTMIKKRKYLYYFSENFTDWLGINLVNKKKHLNYNFFTENDSPDIYGVDSLIENHNGDPAIDISPFLKKRIIDTN
ncbi:MAG: phosphoethanolamine transferase [Candidatus Arsenophonus phytopathogenicus]